MSSPLKKLCLNVPPPVHTMIRARMKQLHYRSESDYLLAVVLADCRFKRPQPHAFAERILNQPAEQRSNDLQRVVDEFKSGATPMDEGDLEATVKWLFVDHFQRLPERLKQLPKKRPSAERARSKR